jgi:ferritin-like metal-binding protein YciE
MENTEIETILFNKLSLVTKVAGIGVGNYLPSLFTDQLGTMHCALSHLALTLSPLVALASFKDLRFAVEESLEDTNRQLVRIEEIAAAFDMTISEENCLGMKAIVESCGQNCNENPGL